MTDASKDNTDATGQGDIVTGNIQGDRVCVVCGFNLYGQRIVRESKYNLLIARCPECGQAAPLQEYPLLGRWANRWAATLAGVWLLWLLLLLIGSGRTISSHAVKTLEYNSEPVMRAINDAHVEWLSKKDPTATNTGGWVAIEKDWWDSVDRDSFLQEIGGVPMIIWRSSQTTWLDLLSAMIPIGCMISVTLLGAPRRRLVMAWIFPVLVACLAGFLYVRMDITHSTWKSMSPYFLAKELVWQWTIPITIAVGSVFLLLGMLIGRPLARFLVRMALPNRFVQALAILWTGEGLEPPKPW